MVDARFKLQKTEIDMAALTSDHQKALIQLQNLNMELDRATQVWCYDNAYVRAYGAFLPVKARIMTIVPFVLSSTPTMALPSSSTNLCISRALLQEREKMVQSVLNLQTQLGKTTGELKQRNSDYNDLMMLMEKKNAALEQLEEDHSKLTEEKMERDAQCDELLKKLAAMQRTLQEKEAELAHMVRTHDEMLDSKRVTSQELRGQEERNDAAGQAMMQMKEEMKRLQELLNKEEDDLAVSVLSEQGALGTLLGEGWGVEGLFCNLCVFAKQPVYILFSLGT
jgi:myosin heavy subunit